MSSSAHIRISKLLLVLCVAVFSSLVVFNNLTDYNSNLEYVRHVLRMDTTFPNNRGMWRGIDSMNLHHIAYLLIILVESAVAILTWAGVVQLWKGRTDPARFERSKALAVTGLTVGVVLYFAGFVAIGGEWFLMWQSETWNSQEEAAMFATIFGVILIYLAQRDAGHE